MLKHEQDELLYRRALQLEGMLKEKDLMLVKLAEDLGLAKPKNILIRPQNYLKAVADNLRDKVIDKGEFSWVSLQLGYLLTALLQQKYGGKLFVNDHPGDESFAEILLGQFEGAQAQKAVNPFKMALAFCWSEPPRNLIAAFQAAENILAKPS